MRTNRFCVGVATVAAVSLTSGIATAQQNTTPLPEVEVIQQQSQPQQTGQVSQAASTASQPTSFEPDSDVASSPAGSHRSPVDGRLVTNAKPTTNPVGGESVMPKDFQNYSGAGNRVTRAQLDEQQPLTYHESLARVPGVITIQDDGLARHGGVGIRGSNFRRNRKVLTMEDGYAINYSSYIDPSTHYTPPIDRIENIEIIRGTVIPWGPLNNHGIVNFQNLNPFGPTETIIKASLMYSEEAIKEWGNTRHVHTRQNVGNAGVVVSYSGADGSGAWDNERLRYNDFFGSIGLKGSMQDFVLSGGYFRQRDDYDEDNFSGTRADFFANRWDKTGAKDDDRTQFNTFNGDYYHLQLAHNFFFNSDTTLSSRAYITDHRRYRFSNREDALADGGHMRGRNRDYQTYGFDSRIEFANLPLFGGMKHDLQVGAKYEHQSFRNCTSFGQVGQKLSINGSSGDCFASTAAGDPDDGEVDKFEADIFAAFIQTSIHVTDNFSVTPGVRFEDYEVDGRDLVSGETGSSDHSHVLPGVAMAWEFMPRWTLFGGYHRGVAPHIIRDVDDMPRDDELGDNFQIGLRSSAIKGVSFDLAYFHSIIDSYQIKQPFTDGAGANIFGTLDEVEFNGIEFGIRADSIKMTGGPWNFFGEAVYTYTNSEINRGVDRLGEETPDIDVSGNRVPFAMQHYAALTLGLGYKSVWDISATYKYRGDLFSDASNQDDVFCEIDGVDDRVDFGCDGFEPGLGAVDTDDMLGGKLDSVWLLSARANYNVTDELSLFMSGYNLTNEFYATDVADGLKPGQGRTIMGGFKMKLQ